MSERELRLAGLEVLRATDAYRDALNGLGHPGREHDQLIHIDPCTSVFGVHVYSTSTDCASCGGAQYGTEHGLQRAIVRLRLALGQPLHRWEEHHRDSLTEPVA